MSGSGVTVEGDVDRLESDGISLKTESGVTRIPLSTIQRIEKPDSVTNGALIGAGSLLGAVAIAAVATGNKNGTTGRTPFTGESVANLLGATGMCAALGALIDHVIPGRDVVWARPSSIATVQLSTTPHLDGLSVRGTITW